MAQHALASPDRVSCWLSRACFVWVCSIMEQGKRTLVERDGQRPRSPKRCFGLIRPGNVPPVGTHRVRLLRNAGNVSQDFSNCFSATPRNSVTVGQSVALHSNTARLSWGRGGRLTTGRWGKRTTKLDHKQPPPLLPRPGARSHYQISKTIRSAADPPYHPLNPLGRLEARTRNDRRSRSRFRSQTTHHG